jgi:endonuclease/exonuclease/phosphatase family metal-dependent hydrolase
LTFACATARRSGAPPEASELTVLVYNVHAGKDAAGRDNLRRVSDVVKSAAADIVLLQEVDKGTRRSGGVDQPSEYARGTGYHVAFARSLDYDGGEYGIAILSRWPIRRDTTIHLPVDPPQERAGGSREPRVAMLATIATPAGEVAVLNTHMDASADDRWRKQEIRTILRLTADMLRDSGVAVLVGGDFNSTPESAVQAELRASGLTDAWLRCGSGDGFTYPADSSRKRIDYLFLTGNVGCVRATVLTTDASDHRPVLFVVRVPRAR